MKLKQRIFHWTPWCFLLMTTPYLSIILYHMWFGMISAWRKRDFPFLKVRILWGDSHLHIEDDGTRSIDDTVVGIALAVLGVCFEVYIKNPKRTALLHTEAA